MQAMKINFVVKNFGFFVSSRCFFVKTCYFGKNSTTDVRQAKNIVKLLDKKGLKKKGFWEPCEFIVRPSENRKPNIRRMGVFNKLLIINIADLLSTGRSNEYLPGRNVIIQGAKISSDFKNVNVFWTSDKEDNDTAHILEKCAGILRHELSQLKLIQVPRIHFVKEKSNAAEVDQALQKLCKPKYNLDPIELNHFQENELLSAFKEGISALDRSQIRDKILTKLRKPK